MIIQVINVVVYLQIVPKEPISRFLLFKTSCSCGLLLILSRLSAVFPLIEVLAYKSIPERLRELANRCKSNQGEHTFCFPLIKLNYVF